jgi:DNA-directed RNA polymerase specialized sigma subunit
MEENFTQQLKALRDGRDKAIVAALSNLELTQEEVAQMFGVTRRWVILVAQKHGVAPRPRGRKAKAVR